MVDARISCLERIAIRGRGWRTSAVGGYVPVAYLSPMLGDLPAQERTFLRRCDVAME